MFAGTRVTIKMVLDLIDNGADRAELVDSSPFLKDEHIATAREYLREHPTRQPKERAPDDRKLKSKHIVEQSVKE